MRCEEERGRGGKWTGRGEARGPWRCSTQGRSPAVTGASNNQKNVLFKKALLDVMRTAPSPGAGDSSLCRSEVGVGTWGGKEAQSPGTPGASSACGVSGFVGREEERWRRARSFYK